MLLSTSVTVKCLSWPHLDEVPPAVAEPAVCDDQMSAGGGESDDLVPCELLAATFNTETTQAAPARLEHTGDETGAQLA